MTTRNTKGITAAVFLSALLLHFLIICAVFLHFTTDRPIPVQTQFVMQSIPKPPPPVRALQKPKPVEKKPKPKSIEKKEVPVPQPVPQENQIEPHEEFVPEEQAEAASESSAVLEDSAAGTESTAVDFKGLIVQRITEKKIYPKAARKRNQEGFVTVNIVVLKSGELALAEIITPCSYKFLNEAALASVRAAAPFPLGDSAPDRIELTVTLEYRLEG